MFSVSQVDSIMGYLKDSHQGGRRNITGFNCDGWKAVATPVSQERWWCVIFVEWTMFLFSPVIRHNYGVVLYLLFLPYNHLAWGWCSIKWCSTERHHSLGVSARSASILGEFPWQSHLSSSSISIFQSPWNYCWPFSRECLFHTMVSALVATHAGPSQDWCLPTQS